MTPDKLLRRNVKRFRGGLVFKAHRLWYHSTLGSRVMKKKKRMPSNSLGDPLPGCARTLSPKPQNRGLRGIKKKRESNVRGATPDPAGHPHSAAAPTSAPPAPPREPPPRPHPDYPGSPPSLPRPRGQRAPPLSHPRPTVRRGVRREDVDSTALPSD